MLNVVDNLNCVYVINKPCMRGARYVRLIPWTLRCGSEQQFINFKYHKYQVTVYSNFFVTNIDFWTLNILFYNKQICF
jgi:hypothetical protein